MCDRSGKAGVLLIVRSGNYKVGASSLSHMFRGNFANSGEGGTGTANVKLCLSGGLSSELNLGLSVASGRARCAELAVAFPGKAIRGLRWTLGDYLLVVGREG